MRCNFPRTSLVVLATLAILACGGEMGRAGESAFTLISSDSSFAPGDTAGLIIKNGSKEDIYVDFRCSTQIEMKSGDGTWEVAFKPDCSNIRVRPQVVAGGKSAVGEFAVQLADAKKGGVFRFKSTVSQGDRTIDLVSTPFVLR